jgi:hypothetical protein
MMDESWCQYRALFDFQKYPFHIRIGNLKEVSATVIEKKIVSFSIDSSCSRSD